MFTLKLHFETALVFDNDKQISKKIETKTTSNIGRIPKDNRSMKIELDLKVMGTKLKPTENVWLEQVIRFKDKQEFIEALQKAMKIFWKDVNVTALRLNPNFKQTLSIHRINSEEDNPGEASADSEATPDFVSEVLAEELSDNARKMEYKITYKNPALNLNQSNKLIETIETIKINKAINREKSRNRKLIVFPLIMLFIFNPSSTILYTILLSIPIIALADNLFRVNYKTAGRISKVANAAERAALYAGFSRGLAAIFSHIKHPFAFIRGRMLSKTTDKAIQEAFKNLNPSIPPKDNQPQDGRHEKAGKAAKAALERMQKTQLPQMQLQLQQANRTQNMPSGQDYKSIELPKP